MHHAYKTRSFDTKTAGSTAYKASYVIKGSRFNEVSERGNKDARGKCVLDKYRGNQDDYLGSELDLNNIIYEWGAFNKTTTVNNIFERKFNMLALKWKEQTGASSNLLRITKNENYKSLIEIGEPIVPFILKDLEKNYSYWFVALQEITQENPVPNEYFGNIKKMAEYWIEWGKKRNMI